MSSLVIPAPFWRRCAALVYDSLLLLGLFLTGTLIAVIVRDALGLVHEPIWAMRLWLLLLGFGFFGWSWTHGGRTPGMLAWRLQLRRIDGASVRWPVAFLRYCAAWPSWGLCGLGALWCLVDSRRRAVHDLIAGTEMVCLPAAARGQRAGETPA